MDLGRNNQGFTLVETVIVLAVAALILAFVFTAVQGAQRSTRDSMRKTSLNAFVDRVYQFSASNNGRLPMSTDIHDACRTNLNGCFIGSLTGFNRDYFLDSTDKIWQDPKHNAVYLLYYSNVDPDPLCTGFNWDPVRLRRMRYHHVDGTGTATASIILENGCYTVTIN